MLTQSFLENISFRTIKCIYEVHKQLGPGLLESVYQACLLEELRNNELNVTDFPYIPIIYKGKNLGGRFQPDLMVENHLLIELKSVEVMIPLYKAQLLTYLKLSGHYKGLLVNFNTENVRDQLFSLVTPYFFQLPK